MSDRSRGRRRGLVVRRLSLFGVAALSAVGLAGCARQGVAAPPPPLKLRGTTLPSHADAVDLTQPVYRGPDLPLYRAAARFFRWPLLVPALPPRGARPTGATISRFFAGSFTLDPKGVASQVPGSYVPGNPVPLAAYQLRITFRTAAASVVTLLEAVHPYAWPHDATPTALPDGLRGGETWQARATPHGPPLRYLEGHVGGLYLIVYADAARASVADLAAYLGRLRSVSVPPGPAPVATTGSAPTVRVTPVTTHPKSGHGRATAKGARHGHAGA